MAKMEALCKFEHFSFVFISMAFFFYYFLFYRRKSFMTRLFSGKGQTLPATVPSPKSTIVPAPLDSLSGIDLGISDSAKNFDSMSTKSASSSKPDEANDMSRLIDTNDDDNDINILNTSTDYDFLNNW